MNDPLFVSVAAGEQGLFALRHAHRDQRPPDKTSLPSGGVATFATSGDPLVWVTHGPSRGGGSVVVLGEMSESPEAYHLYAIPVRGGAAGATLGTPVRFAMPPGCKLPYAAFMDDGGRYMVTVSPSGVYRIPTHEVNVTLWEFNGGDGDDISPPRIISCVTDDKLHGYFGDICGAFSRGAASLSSGFDVCVFGSTQKHYQVAIVFSAPALGKEEEASPGLLQRKASTNMPVRTASCIAHKTLPDVWYAASRPVGTLGVRHEIDHLNAMVVSEVVFSGAACHVARVVEVYVPADPKADAKAFSPYREACADFMGANPSGVAHDARSSALLSVARTFSALDRFGNRPIRESTYGGYSGLAMTLDGHFGIYYGWSAELNVQPAAHETAVFISRIDPLGSLFGSHAEGAATATRNMSRMRLIAQVMRGCGLIVYADAVVRVYTEYCDAVRASTEPLPQPEEYTLAWRKHVRCYAYAVFSLVQSSSANWPDTPGAALSAVRSIVHRPAEHSSAKRRKIA